MDRWGVGEPEETSYLAKTIPLIPSTSPRLPEAIAKQQTDFLFLKLAKLSWLHVSQVPTGKLL